MNIKMMRGFEPIVEINNIALQIGFKKKREQAKKGFKYE